MSRVELRFYPRDIDELRDKLHGDIQALHVKQQQGSASASASAS